MRAHIYQAAQHVVFREATSCSMPFKALKRVMLKYRQTADTKCLAWTKMRILESEQCTLFTIGVKTLLGFLVYYINILTITLYTVDFS